MKAKVNFKEGKGQFFKDVDELYRLRLNALISFASRHVYNRNDALDVIHDAMAKSVEYFAKHPDKFVSERIIQFLILKACKKANRFSKEIPVGDIRDYFVD